MFRDSQEQFHSDEPRFSQLPFVPPRLFVQIERQGAVTLSLDERVVIGRSDGDDTGADLGLDLAAYGGDKTGVSRRHAVFSWRDEAVWIEDLDSTNGTRINGLKLTPNHPYHLHDGDEIELGSARLVVRFVPAAD